MPWPFACKIISVTITPVLRPIVAYSLTRVALTKAKIPTPMPLLSLQEVNPWIVRVSIPVSMNALMETEPVLTIALID